MLQDDVGEGQENIQGDRGGRRKRRKGSNPEEDALRTLRPCRIVLRRVDDARRHPGVLSRRQQRRAEEENSTIRKEVPAQSKLKNKWYLPTKALPMDQTTFKVENLCTFRCTSCQGSFGSFSQVTRHKSCPKSHGNYEVTEAKYHTCCLCSKRMLCDRKVINIHVRGHNSLTWQEYMATAAEKDASGDKHTTFGLEKELDRETRLKSEVALISPPLESIYVQRDVYLPEEKTADSIAYLCLFQCTKCKLTMKKWRTFEAHLMRCVKSVKFRSSYLLEARYYRCEICPLKMLCDPVIIRRHYRKTHKIPSSKLTSHLSSCSVSSCQDNFGKQVPMVSPLPKMTSPSEALPKEKTTDMVEDLCIFSCPNCPHFLVKLDSLQKHARRAHSTVLHFSPQLLHEARYHKCKICGVVVLCDRRCIGMHVAKAHHMPIKRYHELKVRDAGAANSGGGCRKRKTSTV